MSFFRNLLHLLSKCNAGDGSREHLRSAPGHVSPGQRRLAAHFAASISSSRCTVRRSFISPILRLPSLFVNLAVVLGRIWISVGIVAYPYDHCVGDARENVKPMAFTPRAEFVYHVGIYGIERRLGQQVITSTSYEPCVYCLFESGPIVDLLFGTTHTESLVQLGIHIPQAYQFYVFSSLILHTVLYLLILYNYYYCNTIVSQI